MKRTRFTAALLCITTLFAVLGGGVYAEEDVTYIEEATLVIEDGKVISGDKSLVERGIVVIGDAHEDSAEEIDLSTPAVPAEDAENEQEDFGSPVINKAPIKDNSALISPDGNSADVNYDIILPEEIPTAINPNVPVESAKGTYNRICNYNHLTQATQFQSNNDKRYGPGRTNLTYYNLFFYKTQRVILDHYPDVNEHTYKTFLTYVKFYRGGAYGNYTTFAGPMFHAEDGKTFHLSGNSSYSTAYRKALTLDGRVMPYSSNDYNDAANLTGYAKKQDVAGPFLYSEPGGTLCVESVYLQYNQNKTAGTDPYNQKGGAAYIEGDLGAKKAVINMNNCTVTECTAIYGGAIYAKGTGTVNDTTKMGTKDVDGDDMYPVTSNARTYINTCSATYGGAIYVAEGSNLAMTRVDIEGCSATYGGAIYIEQGGTLTMNDVTIKNCSANQGGAIYISGTATLNFTSVKLSGDINGDTTVSSADYIMQKQIISGKLSVSGAFALAVDYNNDKVDSAADYISLRKTIAEN